MGGCNLCALLHFPTVYTQSGDSDNHNQNSSDAPSRCLQRCFCPPWWNRGGSEDQSVPVHLFATICRTQLTHSWLARLENDASHCCVLAILNLSLLNFDDVFSNTSDLILTWLDSEQSKVTRHHQHHSEKMMYAYSCLVLEGKMEQVYIKCILFEPNQDSQHQLYLLSNCD